MIRNDFHDRKQLRIAQHDYASSCVYFVTINVDFHTECFGEIVSRPVGEGHAPPLRNVMRLNAYGKIIEQQWLWLAKQYPYVTLDKFIVMPNHFHGIIAIDSEYRFVRDGRCKTVNDYEFVGEGHAPPLHDMACRVPKRIAPLFEIISAFKSTSSKFIHRAGLPDFKWQRSFHDRIIRNPLEWDFIQKYIDDNPKKYHADKT